MRFVVNPLRAESSSALFPEGRCGVTIIFGESAETMSACYAPEMNIQEGNVMVKNEFANFFCVLNSNIDERGLERMNYSRIIRCLTLGVVLMFIVGAGSVFAVDDLGLFELDANAVQDAGPPPDDWETLFGGGGNQVVFTGIKADPDQETIFVGGRKDIQDIDQWGWKSGGGFPDKDDITNAYGAAYIHDSNLIVYFGADRFANKGDAFLGFWFFQNKVSLNPDGSFEGVHAIGDILVIVNFPQGTNQSPEINVVEWNPPGADIATNLKLLASGAVCSGGGDIACALTNEGDEISPWPYIPKSGTPGIFPFESFFEGGINITEILGGTPCFASFMAESRSSKRFTATLKDFVLDEFPVCKIAVSKTCDVVRLADDSDVNNIMNRFFVVSFEGEVTNTGAGTFPVDSNVIVVDNAGTPGDTNDDAVIIETLGSPLEPNDTVPFSGKFFSDSNPPHNIVSASIEFSGTSIEADDFGIDCNNLILSPSLSVSKRCWSKLATVEDLLAVEVFFSGEVCNTGDVPLMVTVTDDVLCVLLELDDCNVLEETLMEPNECITLEGSYLPPTADGDVNIPCEAMFKDKFTAIGTSPVPDVNDQNAVFTANCALCQDCNSPPE